MWRKNNLLKANMLNRALKRSYKHWGVHRHVPIPPSLCPSIPPSLYPSSHCFPEDELHLPCTMASFFSRSHPLALLSCSHSGAMSLLALRWHPASTASESKACTLFVNLGSNHAVAWFSVCKMSILILPLSHCLSALTHKIVNSLWQGSLLECVPGSTEPWNP